MIEPLGAKTGVSENPLPKSASLPGAVVAQYRTVNGKRYGPYWFRMWREGGRLRKEYVRKEDLEEVRERCESGRQLKRLIRQAKISLKYFPYAYDARLKIKNSTLTKPYLPPPRKWKMVIKALQYHEANNNND